MTETLSPAPTADVEALPAHAQLVLELAHIRLDPARVERIRRTAGREDLEWGAVLDALARHKLLPLVGRHVDRYRLDRDIDGRRGFPYPWVFASAHLGNRQRNLALADEFARVFDELGRNEIRYAVRKGFSIAEELYHDPSVRRISDLDLLVDRTDAGRIMTVLQRLGYQQGKMAVDGDRVEPFDRETQIFWRVNLSNQLPYIKPGFRADVPEYNVDLCHDIFQKKSGSTGPASELLDRRVPMVLCGTPSWVPDPADRLLDVCAHLHKEATSLRFIEDSIDLQIGKFLDVALQAREFGADEWAAFGDRVDVYDARAIAYYALHFTAVLYPAVIPAPVLDRLRPDDLGYLDEYGSMDGETARWAMGFLPRLFDGGRKEGSGRTVVPYN